jgi:hypothetical protein
VATISRTILRIVPSTSDCPKRSRVDLAGPVTGLTPK